MKITEEITRICDLLRGEAPESTVEADPDGRAIIYNKSGVELAVIASPECQLIFASPHTVGHLIDAVPGLESCSLELDGITVTDSMLTLLEKEFYLVEEA